MKNKYKLPDGYITYDEAAKRLGKWKTQISRYVAKGKLTACKINTGYTNHQGVLATDVDAMLVPVVGIKVNKEK